MTMIYILIVVIALVFLPRMEIALYPDIDLPVISVYVDCNDSGPEEIEQQVARELEENFSSLENIKDITTISSNGSCMAILEYEYGTDLDDSESDLTSAITLVSAMLPDWAETPQYFRQEADLVKFGALSTPHATDWDSDGVTDLLSGNSAGELALIRNSGTDSAPEWCAPQMFRVNGVPFRIMAGQNGSIQGPAEEKWGYTVLTTADWDGDGLQDIIINSITGKIEWLRNTGSSDGLELEPPRPVEVSWDGKAPKPAWNWWTPAPDELVTQWRTTPYAIDWNGDSLTDLVMADHEGYLAFYERFRKEDGTLGLMPGKRIFIGTNCSVYDNKKGVTDASEGLLRLNAGEAGKSGRRKICLVDWDGDGLTDLLVDSRNVAWFRNLGTTGGMVHLEYQGDISDVRLAGHSTCPSVFDWDADDIPDIITGAEDGHFYLLRNNTKR